MGWRLLRPASAVASVALVWMLGGCDSGQCKRGKDCGYGAMCYNGVCRASVSELMTCSKNADCNAGNEDVDVFYCDRGYCRMSGLRDDEGTGTSSTGTGTDGNNDVVGNSTLDPDDVYFLVSRGNNRFGIVSSQTDFDVRLGFASKADESGILIRNSDGRPVYTYIDNQNGGDYRILGFERDRGGFEDFPLNAHENDQEIAHVCPEGYRVSRIKIAADSDRLLYNCYLIGIGSESEWFDTDGNEVLGLGYLIRSIGYDGYMIAYSGGTNFLVDPEGNEQELTAIETMTAYRPRPDGFWIYDGRDTRWFVDFDGNVSNDGTYPALPAGTAPAPNITTSHFDADGFLYQIVEVGDNNAKGAVRRGTDGSAELVFNEATHDRSYLLDINLISLQGNQ